MEGTIEHGGNAYWWWAGPANDGAHEGFCVHTRGETYGVTRYMDTEPDEAKARQVATQLIPKVDALS